MATKKGSKKSGGNAPQAEASDAPPNPVGAKHSFGTPKTYAVLVGLGALNALWAAFLWAELLVARAGGTVFCAVAEGMDCTALWDGGFAKAIHAGTGMPVAGWGVVFGVVATVLPLGGLLKTAEGHASAAWFTGVRVTGLVGIVTLVTLLGASLQAGTLCLGCLGTYVLVAAYAGVALGVFKATGDDGFLPDLGGGVGVAAGTAVVSFIVLLYPGLSTPKSLQEQDRATIKQMADATGSNKTSPNQQANPTQQQQQPQQPAEPEDPSTRLKTWLGGAPPQLLQALSDSLYIYKTSKPVPVRPARAVVGDANAPLLITDFTDARCGHCAQLHETLSAIHEAVPPGSFKVESRHFPLDGACNPKIERKAEDAVSCVAAKVEICMEGNPKSYDFAGELFKNGPTLTADKVWSIAARYTDMTALKACVDSKETLAKLVDDISYAEAHELEGTPLVLLNGKKATSLGPFLFAMILTGGDPNHPALAKLPPPNKDAHVH